MNYFFSNFMNAYHTQLLSDSLKCVDMMTVRLTPHTRVTKVTWFRLLSHIFLLSPSHVCLILSGNIILMNKHKKQHIHATVVRETTVRQLRCGLAVVRNL